jgi:hypothetical protein
MMLMSASNMPLAQTAVSRLLARSCVSDYPFSNMVVIFCIKIKKFFKSYQITCSHLQLKSMRNYNDMGLAD